MREIRHRHTGTVLARVDAGTLRGARLAGVDLSGADLGDANRLPQRLMDAPFAFSWWVPLVPLVPAVLVRGRRTDASRLGRIQRRLGFLLACAALPAGFLLILLFTLALTPLIVLDKLLQRRGHRRRAELVDVELAGASLRGADLRGAWLIYADLRGADLTGADLSAPCLFGRRIFPSTLMGCDLHGSTLSGTDLSGANVSCVNLSHASLRGAVLRGTSLKEVDLTGSDLCGADLWGAVLMSVRMDEGTVYDPATRWPQGFDPRSCGAGPPDAPGER